MIVALVIAVVVAVFVLAAMAASVKIVREYQRLVLFRLGRSVGPRGPGLVVLNPVTDRANWVDLREQFLEIPHQTAITRDNAPIAIDFIIFYKVFDPVLSVLSVQNFAGAALNIAATTLRSVVGDMSLDNILSEREQMNEVLRVKLDDVTERWGVKVTNVEVREINPPPGVQEAMTRQMSAERTRRAVVTESEGQKQAAVTVAEGQKQSSILSAEGQKQASILAAEGERQAAVLRAQGLANAMDEISSVAGGLDPNTMLLQYLDAFRQVASSPSSKVLLPMEVTSLLSGLKDLAGRHLDSSTVLAPVAPKTASLSSGNGSGNGSVAAPGSGSADGVAGTSPGSPAASPSVEQGEDEDSSAVA